MTPNRTELQVEAVARDSLVFAFPELHATSAVHAPPSHDQQYDEEAARYGNGGRGVVPRVGADHYSDRRDHEHDCKGTTVETAGAVDDLAGTAEGERRRCGHSAPSLSHRGSYSFMGRLFRSEMKAMASMQ